MASNKHTIVALVADRPGVLNRMASLFRRRGFNIDSIAVGHSETPHLSRMTIVAEGSDNQVEQIRKQIEKIIDVIRVQDISGLDIVSRELALIKVKASAETRSEIMQIVDIFRAKIVDLADKTIIIEATGGCEKIDALERLLDGYGIKEMVRTGRVVLVRGAKTT